MNVRNSTPVTLPHCPCVRPRLAFTSVRGGTPLRMMRTVGSRYPWLSAVQQQHPSPNEYHVSMAKLEYIQPAVCVNASGCGDTCGASRGGHLWAGHGISGDDDELALAASEDETPTYLGISRGARDCGRRGVSVVVEPTAEDRQQADFAHERGWPKQATIAGSSSVFMGMGKGAGPGDEAGCRRYLEKKKAWSQFYLPAAQAGRCARERELCGAGPGPHSCAAAGSAARSEWDTPGFVRDSDLALERHAAVLEGCWVERLPVGTENVEGICWYGSAGGTVRYSQLTVEGSSPGAPFELQAGEDGLRWWWKERENELSVDVARRTVV
ncbi:hypothetical protein GGX14DRAFT_407119 [Mycena pura]|uniref:Uncharacterized protein n=1 Tax=Mycena pura TaxID=153505 RepID=A0AAD6UQE1_9AGAR|nr:hypothetical protein GGX14DRAFT_407119 [Mycena pura]